MSISSLGSSLYQNTGGLTSPSDTTAVSNSSNPTGASQSAANASGAAANNSSLAAAVSQALAQMGGGADLSSLFSSTGQQSGSDFISNLLATLQGSSSSSTNSTSTDLLSSLFGTSSQTATPVTLDPSSPTIGLQSSIQNLISQLDGSNGVSSLLGASSDSSFANLQQSFNSLVSAAGGNPTQTSLQSFLQTVAASIQGSSPIGSLFDTSA